MSVLAPVQPPLCGRPSLLSAHGGLGRFRVRSEAALSRSPISSSWRSR